MDDKNLDEMLAAMNALRDGRKELDSLKAELPSRLAALADLNSRTDALRDRNTPNRTDEEQLAHAKETVALLEAKIRLGQEKKDFDGRAENCLDRIVDNLIVILKLHPSEVWIQTAERLLPELLEKQLRKLREACPNLHFNEPPPTPHLN